MVILSTLSVAMKSIHFHSFLQSQQNCYTDVFFGILITVCLHGWHQRHRKSDVKHYSYIYTSKLNMSGNVSAHWGQLRFCWWPALTSSSWWLHSCPLQTVPGTEHPIGQTMPGNGWRDTKLDKTKSNTNGLVACSRANNISGNARFSRTLQTCEPSLWDSLRKMPGWVFNMRKASWASQSRAGLLLLKIRFLSSIPMIN